MKKPTTIQEAEEAIKVAQAFIQEQKDKQQDILVPDCIKIEKCGVYG